MICFIDVINLILMSILTKFFNLFQEI